MERENGAGGLSLRMCWRTIEPVLLKIDLGGRSLRNVAGMPSFSRRGWVVPLAVIGVIGLFPAEARADAFTVQIAVLFGVIVLIPLLLMEMLVEWFVLAAGLGISARAALWLALLGNLVSILAGLPVLLVNSLLELLLVPHHLPGFLRVYPRVLALQTMVYFATTMAVEVGLVAWWRRRWAPQITLRRVAGVVLVANLATHAVLIPLALGRTAIRHNFREWTDDTSWAHQPPVTVYHIGPDRGLWAVNTAGQQRRLLIPDTVLDYQLAADERWFLYGGPSRTLRLFRPGGEPQTVWQHDERGLLMERVACDPGGTRVAYLRAEELGDWKWHWRLCLWEAGSQRTVPTGYTIPIERGGGRSGLPPPLRTELAWSTEPEVLFVQRSGGVVALRIDPDATVVQLDLAEVSHDLLPVYGRFDGDSRFRMSGGETRFDQDQVGDWSVAATDVRSAHDPRTSMNLEVRHQGQRHLEFDGRPAGNGIPFESAYDVGFVQGGQELLWNSYHSLYLVDVERRRLGLLAPGREWVLPTPRYQRRLAGLAVEP
jgi:hypothetical protein